MREYAAKRELGGRWREGMFVGCDLWDHARPVECVKFVDHVPGLGRVCVTGGWDGRVFAYACDETATRGTGWALVRRFKGCEGGWVASLIASPRCVVAGGTDGKVCAWTFGSSEPTRVLTQGGSVTKIVFVPNRKGEDDVLVAAASTDGDVVVWDLVCGTRLATLRGHLDAVWHVSPLSTELDGTVTLLTSSRDSTLRLWRFGDVDTDELLDVPRGIDGERVIAPATTWRDHDDAILSMTVSDPPSESCVNVGFRVGVYTAVRDVRRGWQDRRPRRGHRCCVYDVDDVSRDVSRWERAGDTSSDVRDVLRVARGPGGVHRRFKPRRHPLPADSPRSRGSASASHVPVARGGVPRW